ncbi:MAG: lysophospholipid acyltransferase family protein [Acidobacteriota bacterium]|nr:lysophospholipid acyltransferase family protein [Acidobacteriota bacterium]
MIALLSTVVAGIRSVVAYVLVSVYVLMAAPLGMLITVCVRHPRSLYWFGRQGVRLGMATVGIGYRVAGDHHVDRSRATVYCVNHASNIEPPVIFMALQAVHPRLRVLYKAEIHKLPLLSRVFDIAGFVPINRRSREHSRLAIDTAAAALREGFSFLVFPEGTRSRTGELLPFKKGGFVMALRGGATIVPLTILGAGQAMRKGSPIVRPVAVSVRIGEPIQPEQYGFDRRDELVSVTRASMQTLLEAGPLEST